MARRRSSYSTAGALGLIATLSTPAAAGENPPDEPLLNLSGHVGASQIGDVPAIAVTLDPGLIWPLTEQWRLGASVQLGYSYGKGILGSRQYENAFAVGRALALLLLDDAGFYRLDLSLGGGPARLAVTGRETNLSATKLSYVLGAGFGAGWFHLQASYFGHRGEPCEQLMNGSTACYPVHMGSAVLLGVEFPLAL